MSASPNVASHLWRLSATQPDRAAIVVADGAGWAQLTFAQLHARSDAIAVGLQAAGIVRGTRTVLLVKPSLDFFALVFALFKVGAVIVLIDPGIGRARLLSCLREVEPEAFIGIPAAHVARLLYPQYFRTVKTLVTVGPRLLWGGHTLRSLEAAGAGRSFALPEFHADELAAILFTSGSTGVPKGAEYTHGIFDTQVRMIRDMYGIQPGEVDLATFPLFALFDPALGMTCVVPDMDARFPGRADPEKLLHALKSHACTNMFGSPALLDRLSRHCVATGQKLPGLRRILSAGAPVRADILARIAGLLDPGAELHTPFGATESLPVATIGSAEVLADTAEGTRAGRGVCVGRPVPGAEVRVIRITDEPIERWSDELLVPPGEVGEITVAGPQVTQAYFRRELETRRSKIREGERFVHRMGDVGAFDAQGRLWMGGRKNHRVRTAAGELYSVQLEAVFDATPGVRRTALVGVGEPGAQRPVLVIERDAGASGSDEALVQAVLAQGATLPLTHVVKEVLVHPGPLPVDVRHNAKIEREKLAVWAATKVSP